MKNIKLYEEFSPEDFDDLEKDLKDLKSLGFETCDAYVAEVKKKDILRTIDLYIVFSKDLNTAFNLLYKQISKFDDSKFPNGTSKPRPSLSWNKVKDFLKIKGGGFDGRGKMGSYSVTKIFGPFGTKIEKEGCDVIDGYSYDTKEEGSGFTKEEIKNAILKKFPNGEIDLTGL